MKNKKFCPICIAKKIIGKAQVTQVSRGAYNNGVAMTPPMGWSSWNLFRHKISEELIKEIADAMKDSGLADAGYCYVNIDDCWQASERDKNGRLQCDKLNFPSGIKALSEYVNERGIKLGIYSSNGTYTCEDYPASLRNERIDAGVSSISNMTFVTTRLYPLLLHGLSALVLQKTVQAGYSLTIHTRI